MSKNVWWTIGLILVAVVFYYGGKTSWKFKAA